MYHYRCETVLTAIYNSQWKKKKRQNLVTSLILFSSPLDSSLTFSFLLYSYLFLSYLSSSPPLFSLIVLYSLCPVTVLVLHISKFTSVTIKIEQQTRTEQTSESEAESVYGFGLEIVIEISHQGLHFVLRHLLHHITLQFVFVVLKIII